MKAVLLMRERIVFQQNAFVEMVLWRLPRPVAGCMHHFKYRLAYVRDGVCLIRYDNESGKGDHRHVRHRESRYVFVSPEQLVRDFLREAKKTNHENRHP